MGMGTGTQDDDECVLLGFVEEPKNKRLLASKHFPSKVGGRPAWLVPKYLPAKADLACGVCRRPLTFLLQVYAPADDDGNTSAFHRSVFVFCCRTARCHGQNGSIKAFRAQLPRANDFYPYEPPEPLSPSATRAASDSDSDSDVTAVAGAGALCVVCGLPADERCGRCRKVWYCGRDHQVRDWRAAHSAECTAAPPPPDASTATDTDVAAEGVARLTVSGTGKKRNAGRRKLRKEVLFREWEMVTEPEVLDDVAEARFEKEHKLLEEYEQRQGRKVVELESSCGAQGTEPVPANGEDIVGDLSDVMVKRDPVFISFQKTVTSNPEQCLRYDRRPGSVPLWVHSSAHCTADDIPPCPACGAPRSFEFQVLPQLLYYLEVDRTDDPRDAIDWATLVVYTCSASCPRATCSSEQTDASASDGSRSTAASNAYVEEFVWRQPPAETLPPR